MTYYLKTINADPTSGDAHDEEKAIFELLNIFKKTPKAILLIETLLVPGQGKTYTPRFFKSLKTLCESYNVLMVADESLTAIRTGAAVHSVEVAGLSPHLLIMGKLFNCSFLLARNDLHTIAGYDVVNAFYSSFTNVAPLYLLLHLALLLRFIIDNNIVRKSQQEGNQMMKVLRDTLKNDDDVYGKGKCIWVRGNNRYMLPITGAVHHRFLPRNDQNGDTLKNIILNADTWMKELLGYNNNAIVLECTFWQCLLCSQSIGTKDKCDCCFRSYHFGCIQDWEKSSKSKFVCPCGGDHRIQAPEKEDMNIDLFAD